MGLLNRIPNIIRDRQGKVFATIMDCVGGGNSPISDNCCETFVREYVLIFVRSFIANEGNEADCLQKYVPVVRRYKFSVHEGNSVVGEYRSGGRAIHTGLAFDGGVVIALDVCGVDNMGCPDSMAMAIGEGKQSKDQSGGSHGWWGGKCIPAKRLCIVENGRSDSDKPSTA